MKQMPYKIEEGAVERAKYRAKMAVREAANPALGSGNKVAWRWASAVAVAAVVVMGVIGYVALFGDILHKTTPMEELLAEMKNAPDEIINEWAVDSCYYLEDENSL